MLSTLQTMRSGHAATRALCTTHIGAALVPHLQHITSGDIRLLDHEHLPEEEAAKLKEALRKHCAERRSRQHKQHLIEGVQARVCGGAERRSLCASGVLHEASL